ncbi:Sterol 3-beta-glucosyltransferase [Chytriomyces hyalinus]|nr:Sterol 3-beta-glucosyltransferase [Chytriomyces hyalinus]
MIVILALGTKGDLIPAVAIAQRLTARNQRVRIVTHARLLVSEWVPSDIECCGVDDEDPHLLDRALVAAVCAQTTFVLASLFCIGPACAAAEARRVPFAAFATFAASDFPHPPEFIQALTDSLPVDLRFSLELRHPLRHWLWRLFINDVGDLREACGLDPMPLALLNGEAPLLFYAIPRPLFALVDDPQMLHDSIRVCGQWILNRSLDNPSFMASHPSVSTFLAERNTRKLIHIGFGSMDCFHPILSQRAEAVRAIIRAIYFGLESANMCALWVVNAREGDACELMEQLTKSAAVQTRICVVRGPVDYAALFASGIVCGSVNHGGIGTILEVLRGGLKQVVAPFMFDQERWGSRLELEGVAKCFCDIDPEFITADEWKIAFEWLGNPQGMENVLRWQGILERSDADDGISLACDAIVEKTRDQLKCNNNDEIK